MEEAKIELCGIKATKELFYIHDIINILIVIYFLDHDISLLTNFI